MGKIESLVGKKYGSSIVLKYSHIHKKSRKAIWLLQCSCGNTFLAPSVGLKSGKSKYHCGCIPRKQRYPRVNLLDRRFDKLVVIKDLGTTNQGIYKGRRKWLCRCDCGNEKIAWHSGLVQGDTHSCGCSRKLSKTRIQDRQEAVVRSLYSALKRRNNKRLGFSNENIINYDRFKELIFKSCYYCGETNSNTAKDCPNYSRTEVKHNGIDRLDSSFGYTEENSVPCCSRCNVAKVNYSEQDFYDWVKKVYTHLKDTGRIK